MCSSEATAWCERGCGRLTLERPDLAAHLAHQVAQALEVLRRGGQPAFGPLTPAAVLEHAGGLLDDGPAVLGASVSTVSSWPCPMIMCCWRPTPSR